MEMWDVYDKDKKLTGKIMPRNEWHMQPGEYYLSVLGVIRRPDGRFLITQRVMTKAWAAGWWEVPGGGVKAGESSLEAVRREVFEETGIDVANAEGGYQFCYSRENPGQNYIVDIYRFEMDVDESDLKLQPEETQNGRFATLDEIKELAAKGVFLHYDSIKRVFE